MFYLIQLIRNASALRCIEKPLAQCSSVLNPLRFTVLRDRRFHAGQSIVLSIGLSNRDDWDDAEALGAWTLSSHVQ